MGRSIYLSPLGIMARAIPCRAADSTGIEFLGDGEWQARKHGVQGRRQWRKVHLAMDTATSDIRAIEFTPGSAGPSHGLRANHCRAADSPLPNVDRLLGGPGI